MKKIYGFNQIILPKSAGVKHFSKQLELEKYLISNCYITTDLLITRDKF